MKRSIRPRTGAGAADARVALGMVALRAQEAIDLSSIATHFASTWAPPAEQEAPGEATDAAVLRIPHGSIVLGFIPMPIPWGDLEWPVATSWSWPEARTELSQHKTHLIVAASSRDLSHVQLSLWHTRAIASVLSCLDAVGVYFGGASIVVSPRQYVEAAAAATEDDLPLFLWLGFHLVKEEDGLSIYTTGLPAFGLLDLEVHRAELEVNELINLVANVAHYELASNVQIQDGETVGTSEDERLEVVHERSRFGAKEMACRIIP